MRYIHGDCGQVIGIEGGTEADLKRGQLAQIRWHFERDMIQALRYGKWIERRSGSTLSRNVIIAIGLVAAEYPNASEERVKASLPRIQGLRSLVQALVPHQCWGRPGLKIVLSVVASVGSQEERALRNMQVTLDFPKCVQMLVVGH